jgi:hypothetical protein
MVDRLLPSTARFHRACVFVNGCCRVDGLCIFKKKEAAVRLPCSLQART